MSKISLPKEVIASIAGKRLALIGFEQAQASILTNAVESAEAFTRSFEMDAVSPEHEALRHFDLLIVNVGVESPADDWLKPDRLASHPKPALFVGPTEALIHRVPALRGASYDFLFAPWRPEEITLRIYHILTETAKKSRGKEVAPADRMRVLIADDDATTTMLVSAAINKSGMECEIASNGGEAVELARQTPPNAAILDINMPHLGGFEVLTALKNDPQTKNTRVLMLTSRQQEADIVRAFGLGADDYVVKPFSPMELIARLRRLLLQAA